MNQTIIKSMWMREFQNGVCGGSESVRLNRLANGEMLKGDFDAMCDALASRTMTSARFLDPSASYKYIRARDSIYGIKRERTLACQIAREDTP